MSDRIIAFPYFGGKFIHLGWLLPLLDTPCSQYVEPFGGSAAVLLNREPVDSEVYNDANGVVVNFFKALRDNREELISKICITPFSRLELDRAVDYLKQPDGDPVEQARCWYVIARQSFDGQGRGWKLPAVKVSSSRHMAITWMRSVDKLDEVWRRMSSVAIEHGNAMEMIARYDQPDTLFYVDPPYLDESNVNQDRNTYSLGGFGIPEHAVLAQVLNQCNGKVAVSGYHGYQDLFYGSNKWKAHEQVVSSGFARHVSTVPQAQRERVEVLWTNY
jgi:DNA adenine methylase